MDTFLIDATLKRALLAIVSGDKDSAQDFLKRLIKNAPPINIDPTFDALRSQPRFDSLLTKMNLTNI